MNVKVSIIIPVYNAETTLRRCVESIIYGYERNIQVILAEDCSRDNSWDLCQTLAREYPNVIAVQNPQNSGVSYTRNRGLSLAQGQYVLFVDSDDWVSGMYVRRLLQTVENHPDALVLCGFRFHDNTAGYQQDYIWDKQAGPVCEVGKANFFALQTKVLLQSPCNKIFHRDIIRNRELRFDEAQSMGEDFQFVLDYMEAAGTRRCVVVNAPLYHYIRATNTSLMSNFGLVEHQAGFARMEQLLRISGAGNEEVQQQYAASVLALKENYIYHVMHSKKLCRNDKLSFIREMGDDTDANKHYRAHQILIIKERLARQIGATAKLPARLISRIRRHHTAKKVNQLRMSLAENLRDATIISQNCIGGVLYHDMGLPFLSPTINTFIPEPDFVKLALNPRQYMAQPLVMHWGEEYPIGTLDDVEIHFMHYETCETAKACWERRKKRINYDKILIIATDRDGFDSAVYEQWQQISYPKVLFTAHPEFTEDGVYFPEYANQGMIGDLIPDRKFYRDSAIIRKLNAF